MLIGKLMVSDLQKVTRHSRMRYTDLGHYMKAPKDCVYYNYANSDYIFSLNF